RRIAKNINHFFRFQTDLDKEREDHFEDHLADQFGDKIDSSESAWTGINLTLDAADKPLTLPRGSANDCFGWRGGVGNGAIWLSSQQGPEFKYASDPVASCSTAQHIYCISL